MKLLWACSFGLTELAIQLITRDGTSRTTKTSNGWTPLLEILRSINDIQHPYSKMPEHARGEVPKLVAFAKMLIDDKRIDINGTVVDEVLWLGRDRDWDDFAVGHSALSLCMQGNDRYNPHLVRHILKSPNLTIDGITLLTLIKFRFFDLFNNLLSQCVIAC